MINIYANCGSRFHHDKEEACYFLEARHDNSLKVTLDDHSPTGRWNVYDLKLDIEQYNVQVHLKGRVVSDIIWSVIEQTSDKHIEAIALGIIERLAKIPGAREKVERALKEDAL